MHLQHSTSNSVVHLNILCFAFITTILHFLLHRILGKTVYNVSSFLFSRVVHDFTSSGMLESQYQDFAEAAKLGNVGDKCIDYGELLI